MAGPQTELAKKGITIVEFIVDGVSHSISISNRYFVNGSLSPQIDEIVQKLLSDIGVIEKRLEIKMDTSDREVRKDEINFVNNSEVNAAWNNRIERLSYLLKLFESGEYRISCILYKCPYHMINGGGCTVCRDLSELLIEIPDLVGCAQGREFLGIDKVYGCQENKRHFGNIMRDRRPRK